MIIEQHNKHIAKFFWTCIREQTNKKLINTLDEIYQDYQILSRSCAIILR